MKNLYHWMLALRVKTLTAAFIPIMAATALVYHDGYKVEWLLSGFAILSALFIQIATNLFNDAIDYKKGTDTEKRLGPKRVTQSGLISNDHVMLGGYFSLGLAVIFGLPLVYFGGWFIAILGLVSLLLAYMYTGGPFPLAYKGLGDLFVILFFGLAAVGGCYYIQTKVFTLGATILGLQIGFLAAALIVINNMRDRDQDLKTNKKTLAVRFGVFFSRIEFFLLNTSPFVLQLYWYWNGAEQVLIYSLVSLPLALYLVYKIFTIDPGVQYNSLLAKSALVHVLFGVSTTIGFFV